MATTDDMKRTVTRWIAEVINAGRLDAAEELCTPRAAERTKGWVGPFRDAFPDVEMETVELVADGSTVVGRFKCSGRVAGQDCQRTGTPGDTHRPVARPARHRPTLRGDRRGLLLPLRR